MLLDILQWAGQGITQPQTPVGLRHSNQARLRCFHHGDKTVFREYALHGVEACQRQCHSRRSSVPMNSNNSVPCKKWWNKKVHVDIYTLHNPVITLSCVWFKHSTPSILSCGREAGCRGQKECRRRLVPPALLSSWQSLGNITDLPGSTFYICKIGAMVPD